MVQNLGRPSLKGDLRVMISGGGTGGHIFPAIAIANAVRERESAAQFLFVGADSRVANKSRIRLGNNHWRLLM